MNQSHQPLKLIALLLSMAVLLQGCNVYRSRVSTVDEAIRNETKVKVKLDDIRIYKFLQLFKVDNVIYGSAKIDSYTAVKLNDQIVSSANNPTVVQIILKDKQIKEVYERNRTVSTIIPLSIIAAFLAIGAVAPSY